MIEIKLAETEKELNGILELQALNHYSNLDAKEKSEQGFVTCMHSMEQLQKMNGFAKSVIAKNDDAVIGYNLAMTKDCKDDIPILIPMFAEINQLHHKNRILADINYIVCGQICIAKAFRGKQLFDQLYKFYASTYSKDYPVIITEIASENLRSLKAHKRVGFKHLKSYTSPYGQDWEIVLWDFK